MKTSNLAIVLSLAAAIGTTAPSFADGTDHSGGVQTAVDGALMVTRVGAAGCGAVIGTPVAIVRETYKYYTTLTPQWADKMGGKDCGPSCAVVSLATIPCSLVAGTVMGAFHGTKNGVVKGFNAPFSPDSFSLGKSYEE